MIRMWTRSAHGLLFAVALVLGSLAAGQATAQQPRVQSQVEELLGGIEYVPSAEEWKKLGPEAEGVLRAIAADSARPPSRRGRALSALAHFPSEETRRFLQETLRAEGTPSLLRRKALQAVASNLGDEALPVLQPYLADPDKRLRESAIRALGTLKAPEARVALQERLQVEDALYLKELLQASLKKP